MTDLLEAVTDLTPGDRITCLCGNLDDLAYNIQQGTIISVALPMFMGYHIATEKMATILWNDGRIGYKWERYLKKL
jgi:hypothetical protein